MDHVKTESSYFSLEFSFGCDSTDILAFSTNDPADVRLPGMEDLCDR